MFTFFHNFRKRMHFWITKQLWIDLPIHKYDMYNFVFILEYFIYSSIISFPIALIINKYIFPNLNSFVKSKPNLFIVFILYVVLQTFVTMFINSLNKIIYDLPSVIELDVKTNTKKLLGLRNDSIKSGISMGTNFIIIPILMNITTLLQQDFVIGKTT